MKNYLYIYHSDATTPPTDEGMKAWMDWFGTLGDKVVDSGNPIVSGTKAKAVFKDGVSKLDEDTVVGYSVVKAESLDEAIKMAEGSPLSNAPGCEVRVYQTSPM